MGKEEKELQFQTEFARLNSIQEELRSVAASMPGEDEVKKIIWSILSGNSFTHEAAQIDNPKPIMKITRNRKRK